jgi:hypothetical protein
MSRCTRIKAQATPAAQGVGADLAATILREVPRVRLVAAIGLIQAERRRRVTGETGDIQFTGDDIDVEAFMADATRRQLRLLRKLALTLELRCEGRL